MRSLAADRLEAVAQAHANVSYPIATDPEPQEADRIAAQKFLAMYDAVQKFPFAPIRELPFERWLEEREAQISDGEA